MGARTEAATARATPSQRPTHVLHRLPLALPVLVLVGTGFSHRWIADDGFIYLRIVRNVVEGNGPVFNQRERVEAYTSPAWVAVLSVSDLVLPIRLEWLAVLLGIGLAVLGVVAAMSGALRLARRPGDVGQGRPPLALPAGALILAAPFASWIWLTSGMETGLIWAWLGCSLWVLARWAESRRPTNLAGQVLLGLGWLIRPELALLSALFLVVVVGGEWSTTSWRQRLGTVAGMMAVPLAYQVFRMGYFGLLVANTAIAKEGTSVQWERGSSYLHDFVDPYWIWFPIVVMALGAYIPLVRRADARRRAVIAAFVVGGTALTLYVVAVGGDYLHGRFFMPAFFALCAPVAALPLERRFAGMLVVVPWALAAFFVLRAPQLEGGPTAGFAFLRASYGDVTTEDLGWIDGRPKMETVTEQTLYLEVNPFVSKYSPAQFRVSDGVPTPAITASAIGAVSYALGPDVHVIDTLGLAHPVGSHFVSSPNPDGAAGHDKPMVAAWLAALVADPTATITPDALGLVVASPGSSSSDFETQVAGARRALACEPLVRLQRAARGDLGPRRFLSNILHAPANTLVRIPQDPAEAVEELC